MTQLIIPGAELGIVDGAFADACERAQRRILEPHAPNTQRAYRRAWRDWRHFCAQYEWDAVPIHPGRLVRYLEALDGMAPASVRQVFAALCALDQEARLAMGDADGPRLRAHPVVTRWLKSWARDHPRRPRRRAPALARSELERILVTMQQRGHRASSLGHLPRYARDRCLILFGIVGCFRGDELAELDAGDVLQMERGLKVTLRRSKTDQQGFGDDKALMPQGAVLRCPVAAWIDWLTLRGVHDGPAFCAIDRRGELGGRLSVDAIRDIVRTRAAAAGVRASSHSMRATFVTLGRERGKSLEALADQGGWRSLDTVRRYARQVDMFVQNPSAGLLDD